MQRTEMICTMIYDENQTYGFSTLTTVKKKYSLCYNSRALLNKRLQLSSLDVTGDQGGKLY